MKHIIMRTDTGKYVRLLWFDYEAVKPGWKLVTTTVRSKAFIWQNECLARDDAKMIWEHCGVMTEMLVASTGSKPTLRETRRREVLGDTAG